MRKILKKTFLAALIAGISLFTAFPAMAGSVCGSPSFSEEEFVDAGPGAAEIKKQKAEGISLGMFTVTGYCGCEICSGGHTLTYSGTVPTPEHTLAADMDRFPAGTRLRIEDIIYTVEDRGSGVQGDIVDIFYGSHEEALAKGTYTAEVFLIEE